MVLRWLALALVSLFFTASAQAQLSAECFDTRDACEAEMLSMCPEGARVLDEQLSSRPDPDSGAPRKHYQLRYECRSAASETTSAAPARAFSPDQFGPMRGAAPPRVPAPAAVAVYDRRAHARQELEYLDGRIKELQQKRAKYGLVGPLVLTGMGLAGTGLFTALWAGAKADADTPSDNGPSSSDERERVSRYRLLAAVSAGMCGGGAIWALAMSSRRQELKPEINKLKRRRRDLLRYELAFAPFARELVLRARF